MYVLIIPVILLIAVSVLFILAKKTYGSEFETVDKKVYKLADIMYVGAYLGYNILGGKHLEWFPKQREKIYKANLRLYGQQEAQKGVELFYMDKLTWVVLMIAIGSIFALFSGLSTYMSAKDYNADNELFRPEYGSGDKYVDYQISAKEKGEEYLVEDITIVIPEKEPTSEQLQSAVEYVKENMPEWILGDNKELDFIAYPLDLISYHERTKLSFVWKLQEDTHLRQGGGISEEITEPISEKIIVEIFYQDEKLETLEYEIRLVPENMVLSRYQLIENQINAEAEEINTQGKNINEEKVQLPENIEVSGDDVLLNWISENFVESDYSGVLQLAFGGILLGIFFFFALDRDLDKAIDHRNFLIKSEFPTFVDKFVLLLNSGNSVNQALSSYMKSLQENNPKKLENPLYKELALALYEIENSGISNIDAFERFGKRVGIADVMKFSSLVAQSIKRGDREIGLALREIVKEAWENKKLLAREQGAKASSKLLIPMMLMLLSVMILVMYPAMSSFGGL